MENTERNKALTEAIGECWHETSFREYELEIQGTIGIFVEKKCSCGEIQRIGKSMLSSSNPLHNNMNNNFSTWEGFGKLFEWSQKQEWWTFGSPFWAGYSKYKNEGRFKIGEAFINPDKFANTVYEFLKEQEK